MLAAIGLNLVSLTFSSNFLFKTEFLFMKYYDYIYVFVRIKFLIPYSLLDLTFLQLVTHQYMVEDLVFLTPSCIIIVHVVSIKYISKKRTLQNFSNKCFLINGTNMGTVSWKNDYPSGTHHFYKCILGITMFLRTGVLNDSNLL